jgi:hypothetical protein
VLRVGAHDAGFYGVLVPSLSAAVRILVADRGMLTVTPIVIVGVVGIVLLARRGMRAEALALGAAGVAMLVYNASLTISPTWVFGGDTPGPRYAYLAIPFVMLPLGLALRRYPSVVVALLAVSLVRMALATATQPLVGAEGTVQWLRLLRLDEFTNTALTYGGLGHGWISILPFFLVVVAAAAAAFASVALEPGWFSGPVFAATIGAWAFVALSAANLVESTGRTETLLAIGIFAIGCLSVALAISSESATTSDTPSIRPAR